MVLASLLLFQSLVFLCSHIELLFPGFGAVQLPTGMNNALRRRFGPPPPPPPLRPQEPMVFVTPFIIPEPQGFVQPVTPPQVLVQPLTPPSTRPCGNIEAVVHQVPTTESNPYDIYAASPDKLLPGSSLYPGQALVSKNKVWYATVQNDGNFVVYKSNVFIPSNSVFDTHTHRSHYSTMRLTLEDKNGKLVLYDEKENAVWAAKASGTGRSLVMEDSGFLTLYDKDCKSIWMGMHRPPYA